MLMIGALLGSYAFGMTGEPDADLLSNKYISSALRKQIGTMPGRTMRLMSLSTRDCRAENATGNFSWCLLLF
jgi:hypothetical protein